MNKIIKEKIKTGKIKNGCHLLVSSLLIILTIGLVSVFADVTLIKAPLSWYEGGSGEYALPKLADAQYSLIGSIATQGQVKTICANYDAVGKVAVEVSVDDGLHYYALTNGVPLKDNFVSGDRIKWRAKILDEDAKLNALSITYTDSAGTISSFGHEELSGFNYRKEILLKNPSGQELYNYQIKLKVGIDKKAEGADVNCEGNVRTDFLDVRFTAADGETPLPYYLDPRFRGDDGEGRGNDKEANQNDAIGSFWVKVPQIPKDGVKIYIYYGNSNAADLSDPKNTFDFYDSFKNTKLDANSWIVNVDPKGSHSIKDGQLKLDAAEIIAKDLKFSQGIIEYSVSVESGFENSLNLRPRSGDSYDSPGLVAYSSVYKGAEHCIAIDDIVKANDGLAIPITAGGKYNYRLTADGNDITFERMDQVNATVQAKVTYSSTSAVKAEYLGLKSGGEGSGRNVMAYSEIRVRKFAKAKPFVNKTGAVEQVQLPIFANIILSKEGNLILYDNTQAGAYITKTIPAPFNVRIIAPVYKGTNVRVNVSADNGKNYKEDCISGNYYYASIKDFISGEKVVAKIKLIPADVKKVISQLGEIKLNYNPGAILMVKPNGAEKLNAGVTEKILWSALDYDNKYPIKLEYSLDSGKNYSIIADDVSNSGLYSWKVPLDAKTKTALIRISDGNYELVNDVSDNVFTIQEAGLAAETPAEETAQAEDETQDEETAKKQAKSELNDLDKDYVIDKNITISTNVDIAFKTLVLGDGTGKHISKIILNNNINPNSGKIIIRNGGQLIQANSDAQAISGDLIIEQGGILTHMENKTEDEYQLNLTAQNITLQTGAIVSVYAKGYSGGEAQQAGAGKAAGVYIGKEARGGKHTYDTERAPKELGSGGAGSLLAKGGAGGGTIRLIAKQEFSISGIINADGKAGAVASDNIYNAAGGAGGSIYLEASKFSGSGAKITASGGSGNKTAGAGGGGRMNIKAPAGKISGTMNANGGAGLNSEAGSVIIE